jgi:large subunit ribosomal protein L6
MSRLIKKSIAIASGVTLVPSGNVLTVKGPKGEIKITLPAGVAVKTEGEQFWVSTTPDTKITALQGTVWALAKNAIEGVTTGFTKVLELEGVGYRVGASKGKELVLFLGYALPVRMPDPGGRRHRRGQEHDHGDRYR